MNAASTPYGHRKIDAGAVRWARGRQLGYQQESVAPLVDGQAELEVVVVGRVGLSVALPSDPHDGVGALAVDGEEVAADAKRAVRFGRHRLVEEDDPDLLVEPGVLPANQR
ncbi:MAG: hypothetical protein ACR2KK_09775 [Acidimicrobiales bacterium]